MIAARWRERLTYLAMSLVVGWHSLAIMVAPMPNGSAAVQSVYSLVQPYLALLRMDNHWNFFAPRIGRHRQFRYVVEDAAGRRHVFIPTEEPSESISEYYMWREWKYLYDAIMDAPEGRGYLLGALYCKKHAALNPVSISLLKVQELDFWPEDYLQGRRPFDSKFIAVTTLSNIDC